MVGRGSDLLLFRIRPGSTMHRMHHGFCSIFWWNDPSKGGANKNDFVQIKPSIVGLGGLTPAIRTIGLLLFDKLCDCLTSFGLSNRFLLHRHLEARLNPPAHLISHLDVMPKIQEHTINNCTFPFPRDSLQDKQTTF